MSVDLKNLSGSPLLVLPKFKFGIIGYKCVSHIVLENGNLFEIQNLKNPIVLLPPNIYKKIAKIRHQQEKIMSRATTKKSTTSTTQNTEQAESESNKNDEPTNSNETSSEKEDDDVPGQSTDVDDPSKPSSSGTIQRIQSTEELTESDCEKDSNEPPPRKKRGRKPKASKTKPKLVVCEVCSKKIKKCNYEDHAKMHLGVKDYVCAICNKAFGWKSSYESHMSVHRTGKLFQCPEKDCGKSYSYQSGLYTHMINLHSKAANERFKCEQCDKEFLRKDTLKEHLRNKHEGDKSWICEICGNKLSTSGGLRTHMREVHGKKRQQCNICQKWLSSVPTLRIHMKITHSAPNSGKYQCITCGKLFPTLSRLKEHEIRHTDARPYKCKTCDRTFRSRANLVGHQNTHLGIKPNKCPFCPKTFTFNSNKIKHMKRHGNNRPHQCNYCQKGFFERQELRKHMICHQKSENQTKNNNNQVFPNMRTPYHDDQQRNVHESELYYANYAT